MGRAETFARRCVRESCCAWDGRGELLTAKGIAIHAII